ncbi:DeoR/GlpR family DNA-binding transcription regulator [Nocardioides sp. cx-173]|uniref:DeoR/GlpR family DNA-binding transcription regulator n=1 Tax=Nocardioides sp. cx-173 TaxID=2898796 RepID=UPI001E403894|nr:DeoR/GlpR family DNA-binding transcription regulator [Nocardioides sp. cx-173]MCD4526120.1 DeoR/GlpR family DNA-binding transcription regulator [Nocardioides sp. cx-173]UGB43809.1 DeoR/GlpR family DNA-binding transcription regulator [Nocardioides sp. cx-173]
MLAAERQARIQREVEHRGAVRVSELARLLNVSDMTIRRDLDTLAAQGGLAKVHGGATVTGGGRASTDEPGFEAKAAQQTAEKEAIAAAAAALVRPGSAIGLSAGTTTWTLAHHLRDVPGLTVVTNSMRIADVLHGAGAAAPNVVLTGGVRTPSDALVGPVAVSSLRLLHLDLVFLGVHGMNARAGFTTPNLHEADTDQALVAAGQRVVVLADHTKWGIVGISTIVPLDQADVVVSDEGLSEEARTMIGESGADLVIAPYRPAGDGYVRTG